jgi:hypothetical protein
MLGRLRFDLVALSLLLAGCPAQIEHHPATKADVSPSPAATPASMIPVAAEPPPSDDAGEPPPDRRPRDIPARFANGLVFPEPRDAPVPTKPEVEVETPTVPALEAAERRCAEGVRGEVFVIDGDTTTSKTYEELLRDAEPTVIEGRGKPRPALSLDRVVPGASKIQIWPCEGEPLIETLPSKMLLLQASQGFGKLIPDATTRRPVIRNIAAIVVLERS